MKKTFFILLILALALTACSASTTAETNSVTDTSTSSETTQQIADIPSEPLSVNFADEDLNPVDAASAVAITFSGDSITVNGDGATVNGSTVTITAPGSYSFSGNLNNGQIAVDTDAEGTVNLILNGVKGVNRVLYDISTKPPASIEWE